jgi:hypothetical protein
MNVVASIFLVCILWVGVAQAVLISEDSSYGPGSITFDTDTGLKWLDVTVTYGQSTADVESLLEPTGPFRYATTSELCGLSTSFFGAASCGDIFGFQPLDPTKFQQFVDLLAQPGDVRLRGRLDPDPLNGTVFVAAFFSTFEADLQAVNFPRGAFDNEGSFLVTLIPEPSTLISAGSGVVLLAALLRRRRR